MIISPGRNYIFVHIPKTGGTSLALALEGRAMRDDILIGDTPKAKKRRRRIKDAQTAGRLWKHSTLADIDGLVSPDFVAQALCFTLVRNPWDRMVSYYHWLQVQTFDHPAVARARAADFTGFLNAAEIQASIRAADYASYMRAAKGEPQAQLYIRLEHFESDAAPLWAHLGFRLDLPHENRSDRAQDYRGYYNEADAELVSRLCAVDIERFGYKF
ncbi:sulfotransferase family 2 domain-containing protein [Roseovarius sp. MMSF_3350]|uniref:sulfotransferase family 2 domain-containing protein n=1 Tax=Roseovarius sp. MMSF_3350 TaxID=3046706 RepID=UPI00273E74D7|nr:sulfotransferase family 2 domain-containing protein [Roseovarius sp. MMSF_3350]